MNVPRSAYHATSSDPLDGTIGPAGELTTMKLTPQSGSIADYCRGVRKSLVALTQGEDTRQFPLLLPDLEDILDRFILWAGNMGAWHPPHSRMSLDSRLSESPEVRHQISQLLKDLYEAIQDGRTPLTLPRLKFTLIKYSENGMFRGRRQQGHWLHFYAGACYHTGRSRIGE